MCIFRVHTMLAGRMYVEMCIEHSVKYIYTDNGREIDSTILFVVLVVLFISIFLSHTYTLPLSSPFP